MPHVDRKSNEIYKFYTLLENDVIHDTKTKYAYVFPKIHPSLMF